MRLSDGTFFAHHLCGADPRLEFHPYYRASGTRLLHCSETRPRPMNAEERKEADREFRAKNWLPPKDVVRKRNRRGGLSRALSRTRSGEQRVGQYPLGRNAADDRLRVGGGS